MVVSLLFGHKSFTLETYKLCIFNSIRSCIICFQIMDYTEFDCKLCDESGTNRCHYPSVNFCEHYVNKHGADKTILRIADMLGKPLIDDEHIDSYLLDVLYRVLRKAQMPPHISLVIGDDIDMPTYIRSLIAHRYNTFNTFPENESALLAIVVPRFKRDCTHFAIRRFKTVAFMSMRQVFGKDVARLIVQKVQMPVSEAWFVGWQKLLPKM